MWFLIPRFLQPMLGSPRIAESHVLADPPVLIPSIYTATSRRTNFLPLSHRIAGSNTSALHRKAAAAEPRFTIGKSDIFKNPLLFDLQPIWERYYCISITWTQHEHQTAAGGYRTETALSTRYQKSAS